MVILYSLLARTTLKYDSFTLTTTLPVTYMHTVEWILLTPKYQAGGDYLRPLDPLRIIHHV